MLEDQKSRKEPVFRVTCSQTSEKLVPKSLQVMPHFSQSTHYIKHQFTGTLLTIPCPPGSRSMENASRKMSGAVPFFN